MKRKNGLQLFWSIPQTTVLVVAGFMISYFVLGDPASLDLVLFILGAIPIFLYLPSLLSNSSSGALHSPKVFFRKVGTGKRINRGDQGDGGGEYLTPKNLVLAGFLTWIIGLMLFLE